MRLIPIPLVFLSRGTPRYDASLAAPPACAGGEGGASGLQSPPRPSGLSTLGELESLLDVTKWHLAMPSTAQGAARGNEG